jgi:hypothetical protein
MMTSHELETFTQEWAEAAARHSLAGDTLRLQQNENYWRRILLAHVAVGAQRNALAVLRRALFVKATGEAA